MPAELVHSLRLWRAAVRAVASSGMFTPVGPRALVALVRGFLRYGPTPALLLAFSAIRCPDRVAVVDERGELTYRRLHQRAEAVAAAVLARSPSAPRTVGIVCRNHRGFVEAMAAGARLGAELIFVNTELPPRQLRAILHRHHPDVLIHDEEFAAAIEESEYAGLRVLAWHEPGAGARSAPTLDELAGERNPPPPPVRRPVKLTLLTSGTTGLAKGVPRAVKPRAIALLGATAMANLRPRSSDVTLVAPPFFHGFGLLALLGPLAMGGTVVCRRRFDAVRALEDIERHRVTVVMAVPVMLQRLLAVGEPRATASLRTIVTGAAPISPATVSAVIEAFGPILVNGYGSTEAGLVTIAVPGDLAVAPDTVGRRALGASVRILRTDRTRAPEGEIGAIFVRTALGYDGYTPDADARTSAKEVAKEVIDGHVDTGDLGHLDAEGRLYVDGRSDDMIVSGGENVFPGEVEDRLVAHADIADAVVVGVPDAEYGQVLHAFVVAAAGVVAPPEDALKQHVRDGLERYKVPKRFTVLDEIPRNASGKVLRAQLRTP